MRLAYTIIYISISISIFGQESPYIVRENALWSTMEVHCMPNGNNYSTYHVKFEGDTVIEGYTYKMVWKTWEETLDNWTLNCFIREDAEGKVFLLPLGYIEGVVYNFGVIQGDTIQVRNLYLNSDTLNFVVTSVDSILMLDGYRKRVTLFEYNNSKEEIWVEGLGSWFGILNSCNDSYGGACGLYSALCYEEEEVLVYQDPEYLTCHYEQLVSVSDIEEFTVNIFPNPAADFVFIDFEKDFESSTNIKLELVNMQGQIILSKNFTSEKILLYLHEVDKGFYIIKIIKDGVSYPAFRLIVD